ncbi:MAG: very short patch repair endonuclease [Acidobacteriota bacterium]|nr:very short patch repair endonuclease [Acidobacteriota bacterium]
MRRNRGRGNRSTELRFAAILRNEKIAGWRRHVSLPGTPDFTFQREHVCVFIHGCFWHGCARCSKTPASNRDFWRRKILQNRRRDRTARLALEGRGFTVFEFWECQLGGNKLARRLAQLRSALRAAVSGRLIRPRKKVDADA